MRYELVLVWIILDGFHPVRQVDRSSIHAQRHTISEMFPYFSVYIRVNPVVETCAKAVVFVLTVEYIFILLHQQFHFIFGLLRFCYIHHHHRWGSYLHRRQRIKRPWCRKLILRC